MWRFRFIIHPTHAPSFGDNQLKFRTQQKTGTTNAKPIEISLQFRLIVTMQRTKEREDQRTRRPRVEDQRTRASGDQRSAGLENKKTKGTGIGWPGDQRDAKTRRPDKPEGQHKKRSKELETVGPGKQGSKKPEDPGSAGPGDDGAREARDQRTGGPQDQESTGPEDQPSSQTLDRTASRQTFSNQKPLARSFAREV